MAGKNSMAFLTAVSLIIILLTVLCGVLLHGALSDRKAYDGTFVNGKNVVSPADKRLERMIRNGYIYKASQENFRG